MPLPDWETVQGDTANPLRRVLYDANGDLINLNDANVESVTFSLVRQYRRDLPKVDKSPATIVQVGEPDDVDYADGGVVQYDGWQADEVDESGWFWGDFEITYSGGGTLTVPSEPILIWIHPQRT